MLRVGQGVDHLWNLVQRAGQHGSNAAFRVIRAVPEFLRNRVDRLFQHVLDGVANGLVLVDFFLSRRPQAGRRLFQARHLGLVVVTVPLEQRRAGRLVHGQFLFSSMNGRVPLADEQEHREAGHDIRPGLLS